MISQQQPTDWPSTQHVPAVGLLAVCICEVSMQALLHPSLGRKCCMVRSGEVSSPFRQIMHTQPDTDMQAACLEKTSLAHTLSPDNTGQHTRSAGPHRLDPMHTLLHARKPHHGAIEEVAGSGGIRKLPQHGRVHAAHVLGGQIHGPRAPVQHARWQVAVPHGILQPPLERCPVFLRHSTRTISTYEAGQGCLS